MFTAALGVGALQAQDTKSVEGIWFAETTVANNVVRQENNLKGDFKDAKQFAIELPGQKEKTVFAKEEFLNAFDTPLSETIISPKEAPAEKEAFADVKGFAIATESQADLTKFSKEEFLQALGEPVEMRVDFNPKYIVSIKAGELLIAEINGSGFTDRYKIKDVKKSKEGFRIITTLGEEFTLENNAGGLLLTKTKSLSKTPKMQMQLSK